MVLNKDYKPEEEDDEWDMVPDDVGKGEEKQALLAEEKEEEVAAASNDAKTEQSDTSTSSPPDDGTPDEVAAAESEEPIPEQKVNGEEEEEDKSTMQDSQETNEGQSTGPSQTSEPPPSLPPWLRTSLSKVGTILKDVEEKHDLNRKTRESFKAVGSSLRDVGTAIQKETEEARKNIGAESKRLAKELETKAIEFDIKGKAKVAESKVNEFGQSISKNAKKAEESISKGAKTAGQAISKGAEVAGTKVKELNKDGKVTDIIAAAAVVGAAVLVAKGKPGAGAAVAATGGAAYMAGEAAKAPRRYEEGLNEELHLD